MNSAHKIITIARRFCNFGNVLSLQKLDDGDIVAMEKTIKDRYKNWLDERMENIDYIDFFGPIFDTNPEEFSFFCGDIRMIEQIAEYVRTTVQKRGYSYFRGVGGRIEETNECQDNDQHHHAEHDFQEQLFKAVADLLLPYGDEVVSLFKPEMVMVTIEDKLIKGRIRCILCEIELKADKKKKRRRQEFYSQYWNGSSWCVSNFANHHLKNVHSINNYTRLQVEQKAKGDVCDLEINENIDQILTPTQMRPSMT